MIINAIKDGVGITGGGTKPPVLEQLSATENGTYTPSDGVDGFSPVEVNVQPPLQTKAIEITANGQSTIEADSGFYGLESVGLNVNVQPSLQAKSSTTTITENGTSTITLQPDSNYDGLSSASVDVNVNVPIPEFTTEELVATANGTYTPSTNGYSKVRVNVSEPVSKYVVPNGMKFGRTEVFNVEDFDFSNVTDMSNMFYYCNSLTSLDIGGWDVSNVTNMGSMFDSCTNITSLDLSNFVTSKVTNMGGMFNGCYRLTSLDIGGWNVSNVASMGSMFSNCKSLTSLDIGGWNVSNVARMDWMFNFCSNITSIDLSTWNMNNVTNMNYMFNGCKVLTDLNMNGAILPKMNLTNWYINTCTALTVDSLVSVINALPQLDSGTSYTCQLGADNLAKLSDEQKAIATNKGWTLN